MLILTTKKNATKKQKKQRKLNISVNINMRTSIVMEKLKPGNPVRVDKHIIGDHMNRHQMRRFSWFRLLIGLLYTSAFK